jgi:hypothetical protein
VPRDKRAAGSIAAGSSASGSPDDPYPPYPRGVADAPWDPREQPRPPDEELNSSAPQAGRRRTGLLTTAVVVALALLAGVAVYLTRHPGGKSGRSPSPVPAGDSRNPASATRSAPRASSTSRTRTAPAVRGPITTNQIFPHAQVVANGLRFSRVIAVLNKNCAVTARGSFAAALTATGCQRVARATFVDSARQYAVTAGVAQLPGNAAADPVDRTRSFLRDIWFVGLNGPARAGAGLVSKTVGYGYETVDGRYMVYALATYSNGHNPAGQPGEIATLRALSQSFTALLRPPGAAPAG